MYNVYFKFIIFLTVAFILSICPGSKVKSVTSNLCVKYDSLRPIWSGNMVKTLDTYSSGDLVVHDLRP